MASYRNKADRDFRIVTSAQKPQSLSFNKIMVGNKKLANDVTIDTDHFAVANSYGGRRAVKKEDVERALQTSNITNLRSYSNLFFNSNGIYSRLCRYMAYLYKYDWYVTPLIYAENDNDKTKEKIKKNWYKAISYLDSSQLKKNFGEIALKVIKDGCYYGYRLDGQTATFLQDLPTSYCRSRYELNGRFAVEFNIKYFDDAFSDVEYRTRVLKMWPKEFQKAYLAFKNGNLVTDFNGDSAGWFLLDTTKAVKFNLSNNDAPLFATVIPKLIDLSDAQDLDKKKMLQQILKIIIQTMPIDKNGDLIFDIQEAQQLHANAVNMLSDAIGVDVLTTFADVKVADMADHSAVSSVDQLEKIERTVFNEAGTGQNLFNAEGNLALEKSILNDEATLNNLILQFEDFAQRLISTFNKSPNRVFYKVQILPTTVYNYKDLAAKYKELATLGYSKVLPLVALGQSQSMVIMSSYFENNVLNLNDVFVPLQSSNTLSADNSKEVTSAGETNPQGGRPSLADDEKSDKTIQNEESEG
nr:MAG TPA: portal protein [Caudoviricetes sp.]